MPANRRPTSSTLCDPGGSARHASDGKARRPDAPHRHAARDRLPGRQSRRSRHLAQPLAEGYDGHAPVVQVYTAGPDGVLGNTDDIKVVAPVFWNGLGRKITLKSH